MASARIGTPYAPSAGRSRYPSAHLVARGWGAFACEQALAWLERARQRRQLRQLGDHMLKDIGLTRADVEAEAAKPFWRA